MVRNARLHDKTNRSVRCESAHRHSPLFQRLRSVREDATAIRLAVIKAELSCKDHYRVVSLAKKSGQFLRMTPSLMYACAVHPERAKINKETTVAIANGMYKDLGVVFLGTSGLATGKMELFSETQNFFILFSL